MNRTYECMVLLDNREVRKGWDTLKGNVTGMMTKHGAKIVSAKLWEERVLAYKIGQQQRGTYMLVYFDAPTEGITPLNRELNMAEPVMRHMVTVCDEVPESAHTPEAEFDESAIGTDKPAAEDKKPADDRRPARPSAPAADRDGAAAEKATTEKPAAEKPAAEKAASEKAAAEKGNDATDAATEEKE